MAQECKKTLHVYRPGTREFVPIEVAPGALVHEVLNAIGEQGAMALATEGRPGLVILAHSTVWNWVADGQRLVVLSSYPS